MFRDDQVADFLEELGAYIEAHLAQFDTVSRLLLRKGQKCGTATRKKNIQAEV